MSVAIVGAGPGDPGLITVRGLELVEAAEVLVYDRLVSPELVARAAEAELIARDELTQRQVNEVLVREGARGLAVVRLKGGDPFVFGRGGEEAAALAAGWGRVRGRARSVDADRAPCARGDPAHAPRHLCVR